jgi:hypothetical protein
MTAIMADAAVVVWSYESTHIPSLPFFSDTLFYSSRSLLAELMGFLSTFVRSSAGFSLIRPVGYESCRCIYSL